jgi:multidrug efflux pump subunit AcrA (membrane-fusion protein)
MNKSRLRILTINLVIVVAIAAVAFWGYSSIHPKAAKVALTTVTVTRGDVSSTVSSSGTVVSPTDIALAPTTAGTLAKINVKAGDSVHAGEVLAVMDTTALKSTLAQAKASLVQAQANLTSAQTTASETAALQLQNDQAAVTNAENNLAYQQTLIAASQATDATNVTTAQNNLAYQQTLIAASQSTDSENVANALTKLNNDKTTTTQNAVTYQASVDSAKNSLTNAQLTFNDYEGVYGPPMGLITPAYCATINTINANCTTVIQDNNAVINAQAAYNSALLSQTQNLAKDAQTIATDQQSYNDAQATAALNIKKNAQSLATYQQAVTDAQNTAALNIKKNAQTLASAQQSITSAQYTLKLYQLQNNSTTTSTTIAVDEAQVSVAESNFITAQKNLKGATVVAPVSGKIASISNSLIGSTISPNTTPTNGTTGATGFIVLTDVGGLQVTAGFSESDVAKIAVGQSASMAFTALPNAVGDAKVSSVALLPTTSGGATTYTVTFQLTAKVDGLKPGMTATATVIVADSPNAISVTSRAVTTRGTRSTVNVVTTVGGKQTETPTPVLVGIVGDSADEILSGLKVGQVVALPSVVSSSSSLSGVPSVLGGAGIGGITGGGGRGGGGAGIVISGGGFGG